MRKPYFIEEEEDDGLSASLAEMEAGVSSPCCYNPQSYYYSISSPRSVVVSGKFHDFRFFDNNNSYVYGQQPLAHFLDSCFLCKKRLGDNRDIFMYRYIFFV